MGSEEEIIGKRGFWWGRKRSLLERERIQVRREEEINSERGFWWRGKRRLLVREDSSGEESGYYW